MNTDLARRSQRVTRVVALCVLAIGLAVFAHSKKHIATMYWDLYQTQQLFELPKNQSVKAPQRDGSRAQFAANIRDLARAENARIAAAQILISRALARQSGRTDGQIDLVLQQYQIFYRIDPDLPATEQQRLLAKRAQPIPEDLVVAQAAIESGWGRSRFATEAKNLFGQHCHWDGCGIRPKGVKTSSSLQVQRFATHAHAVQAYYRNINTHDAYQSFRDMRWTLIETAQPLQAPILAQGLEMYSEQSTRYVKQLKQVLQSDVLKTAIADRTNAP